MHPQVAASDAYLSCRISIDKEQMQQRRAQFEVISYYIRTMMLRLSRHVRDFGLPPWVLWIGGPCCLVLIHHGLFLREPVLAPYIWTFLGLGTLLHLNGARRASFLRQCFAPDTVRTIRVSEAILTVFPFAVLLLTDGEFIFAGVIFVLGLAVSLSPMTVNLHIVIPSPFYKFPFEFTTGFRRWVLLILVAYLLGWVALGVDNFNLALFSLLCLGLISLGFYSRSEPSYYVWIHRFSAREFLWVKMRVAVRHFVLLAAPNIVLLLVMDLTQWWLVLLTVVICLLLVLMCLLGKYAYYPAEIPIIPGLAIAFCVLFPPLVIVVLPFFYRRALQNCRSILT